MHLNALPPGGEYRNAFKCITAPGGIQKCIQMHHRPGGKTEIHLNALPPRGEYINALHYRPGGGTEMHLNALPPRGEYRNAFKCITAPGRVQKCI